MMSIGRWSGSPAGPARHQLTASVQARLASDPLRDLAGDVTGFEELVGLGALGYVVEVGLLPANPASQVHWHAPKTAVAVNPATIASPAQVRAILAQTTRIKPELAAFFGCLYYAALRPEEAVALRRDDLILPARGRGTIILTAACPRTRHRLDQHRHLV